MKLIKEELDSKTFQYMESPERERIKYVSVFMAGGIQGCRNWQRDLAFALKRSGIHLTVFNPRRSERFKRGDKAAYHEQVKWEFDHIREAQIVSFFFASGTPNPTTLFEYGAALERNLLDDGPSQTIVVGCDSDYEKKRCVNKQTELLDLDIEVHEGFSNFTNALVKVIEADFVAF